MSHLRDAPSRIWPGELVWPRYLTPQDLAADERVRRMDQLEATVYARTRSLRSWRIKRLLRRKGYAFKVVDLTGDAEPDPCLSGTNGSETAPQVFVDGRPVGGLRVISALDRSGDLDRLVRGDV